MPAAPLLAVGVHGFITSMTYCSLSAAALPIEVEVEHKGRDMRCHLTRSVDLLCECLCVCVCVSLLLFCVVVADTL